MDVKRGPILEEKVGKKAQGNASIVGRKVFQNELMLSIEKKKRNKQD